MGNRVAHRGNGRRHAVGLLASLPILAASALISTQPASACSCSVGTVADFSEWNDIGFVGTLVAREEPVEDRFRTVPESNVPHRFAVERWIFGGPDERRVDGEADSQLPQTTLAEDEVTVYSPSNGGACGFELRNGERAAIFARESGERFVGGLCATMPSEVALAEMEPTAAVPGLARFAVFGNFEGKLAAYFDATGRFLGYEGEHSSEGSWQPASLPCHDGIHAAVLDHLTLRAVEMATAEDVVAPITFDEDMGPEMLGCTNPGDVVIVEEGVDGVNRRRDATTGQTTTLFERPGRAMAATDDGIAVVEYLDPGERLLLINDDGERELARIDREEDEDHRGYASVAAAPSGDGLAVLEVDYRRPGPVISTVRLIDTDTGDERIARTIEGESWAASWLDPDHLGVTFGSDSVSHIEILDASNLQSVGRVPDWRSSEPLLFEGVLWGLNDGTLFRAEIDREPEAVFTFPVRTWARLMILPAPVDRSAVEPTAATSVDAEPNDGFRAPETRSASPAAGADGSGELAPSEVESDGDDSDGFGWWWAVVSAVCFGLALYGIPAIRRVVERRAARSRDTGGPTSGA